MKLRFLAAALACLAAWSSPAPACSTFAIHDKGVHLFGQNYDWMVPDGMLMVNQRGVAKEGMQQGLTPRWVAKYGSVSVNQYGKEQPIGGMNEAGLVIAVMWLNETEYPAPDKRPAIGPLQWVQYQLDTASTVDDVLATDSRMRIASEQGAKVHFLVSDKTGGTAAIEFLAGKMVVHRGQDMPTCVLTNDTYESSAAYLKQRTGFGGTLPIPDGPGSLDRFGRAARQLAASPGKMDAIKSDQVPFPFTLLENLAQPGFTKWTIVYDQSGQRITFHTASAPEQRWVDFKSLDFKCGKPAKAIDINKGTGDLAPQLVDYTTEANAALLRSSVAATPFLKDMKPETVEMMAKVPAMFPCVGEE